MGRFQKPGQVRRPAIDKPAFAARGEREADQHPILGPASSSPAATYILNHLIRSQMTKSFCSLSLLYLLALPVSGQTSLVAREGFEVETWLPGFTSIGAFDVSDTLVYINDGDTIHMMDIRSGEEMERYGLPGDYSSTRYVSFLTVTPDGRSVWTGYTSDGNLDDRIYSLNLASGQWVQRATFPGNMDLVFWHDSILVSGLNSISWDAPASVFVLDTSGTNHHRKIIEVGGYSAGLAIDNDGNLYY
jgi:hypothetical protein